MKKRHGFTLVELIVVIAITGVIAGIFAMLLGPTLQNYLAVGRRANLTHLADTALRRMVAEIHTAVPNSLRLLPDPASGSICLEMVPSSDGGRFRIAPDSDWDQANPGYPSMPLYMNQPGSGFDVLTPFINPPNNGDFVVIGNQNTNDVYSGADRAVIKSVGSPPGTGTHPPLGLSRITLSAPTQFPYGYEGGRFYVVPQTLRDVTYECQGAGKDSDGSGTGTLTRVVNYNFNPAQVCPIPGGALVATHVAACNFVYNPSQGATQQSGFAQLQLTLSDHGETVTLTVGSQVENLP